MKRHNAPYLVAGLFLVAAGWWYMHHRTASRDDPSLPVRQIEVLPSSEFLNVPASIAHYRERILKEPDVVAPYIELAQVYLQQARETAEETRYVPLAQDLLDEALQRDPKNFHARVLQASLVNTLHRFEEALMLADELLNEHPRDAFTHGIRVDALVELGHYEAAVAACDRLIEIRPGLPSYARAAYLRELHGDTNGALEAMKLAADAGVAGRSDRAWTIYQLGNLFLDAGEPDTARRLFEGLLEERPDYAFAVGGLGHVELVEGNFTESIALLQEAYGLAPSTAFLELLAEAYSVTHNDERRTETITLIQRHYRDAEAMGENIRSEFADFLADEEIMLKKALRLARQEYKRRPYHLHVLETYAWVLYKNRHFEEAIPYIERAMRLGTGDAMVYYRAGMIYLAAGKVDRAREYLERALDHRLHVESPTTARNVRELLD